MSQTRKKPRQRRKDARPEEIRQAALEELAEKGVDGSTLGGIAKRAGISRTTIYLYFQTKQDILEAVLRDTIERNIDEAAARIASFEGPFETMLTMVLDVIYDQLVAGHGPLILRALVAEGQEQSDLVEFYHREIYSKGEATLRYLLARGVEKGELNPSARDLDPRVIIAPAIMAGFWGLIFADIAKIDLQQLKQHHIDLVLHGVLKRPG